MPFLTVSKGGVEIDDGVYMVVLAKLDGPKTILRPDGTEAEIIDWTFQVFEGPYEGTELQGTTSTASGPKSKMFAWLTALLGGRPPVVGQSFEKADLVSKLAYATVRTPENGWPKIENLGAVPAEVLAGKVASATGAPVMAPGAPAPVAVAPGAVAGAAAAGAPADELPF